MTNLPMTKQNDKFSGKAHDVRLSLSKGIDCVKYLTRDYKHGNYLNVLDRGFRSKNNWKQAIRQIEELISMQEEIEKKCLHKLKQREDRK